LTFFGIDKLINAEVAIITIAYWDYYWFINAQFSLNKIAAGYTKRKYH
jgi:hypothetical protein